MKAVIIIAIVLQALGIIMKSIGFISLCKDKELETSGFERYATYTLPMSIFFEIVFILCLVFGGF